MTKKSSTPAIRFKGFTDTWEQRKLGDMMNVTSVKRIHQSDWTDSGVRFLRARDIVAAAKNEEPDDYLYISKEKYEEYSALSGKVGVSDLLVTGVGTIGVPYLVRNLEPLYFKDGNIIWFQNSDKIDGKFLFYSFSAEQIQGFINESAGIGTVGTYTIESGKKTPISLPNQIEQAKVGEFFQQLDNLITLHQRKYDKLTNVKKSMLEKMFPKNGSNVPEIRFKGFTEAWEQRKLSDLIIEYKETVDSDCTLPVLTSSKTEGVVLQEEHFGRVQNHDITGYNILPRNYCTYRNRSDGVDFTFNINRCCDKGIISKFYPVFYGNNSDIFFISMVLNYCDEVVREIAYTCTGTGQKVLSFLDLQKMNIRVPSYDEQKKISQYFEQLDNLITLHQRELEKLKNLKKACLEKMFV